MSIEEENKAKQLRVVDGINKGNLEIIPEFFVPNYSIITPIGLIIKSADEFKKAVIMLRTAFPDIHYAVDDMFAEGDKVATRFTMTGTFKGELMGIAPTGKKFAITGILITRWVDGKEVEAWEVRNMLDFYQQLGITSPSQ